MEYSVFAAKGGPSGNRQLAANCGFFKRVACASSACEMPISSSVARSPALLTNANCTATSAVNSAGSSVGFHSTPMRPITVFCTSRNAGVGFTLAQPAKLTAAMEIIKVCGVVMFGGVRAADFPPRAPVVLFHDFGVLDH